MPAFEGVAKRGPEGGRIVLTLEYKIPRADWPLYRNGGAPITDAIDCLRQLVRDCEAGNLTYQDLIDGAEGVDLYIGK
ncbi:hypothetical protein SEQ_HALENA_51 [Mycobacterium phage Halena]|uniref:Uncharacterized protein n=3 Tax=Bronvirus TaxID=1623278 RepID=A0A482JB04_9CAUD|nr:hypothetical protein UPIE_52 [Mycobacterium phage UPIE]AEZ50729.1 hypothetical protein [Mycobacterium phage Fezzik]AYD82231.1 hypothetical protein SEA_WAMBURGRXPRESS_52 [Mycobacterium phage Wamburgrxpress]QBP29835.1 hypothetical protein SEQ_HALENA_51 [Mycobacterium phage Halena]UEM46337.1 hypothetical protein SEA_ENCELADUS_51 [Mycobacterium phage Enceladus]